MNGLFLFHRDFRIQDNITLHKLNSLCSKIYVCFIFTPQQVSKSNIYKSDNSIQFMIESLTELKDDIESKGGDLLIYYGDTLKIVTKLVKELNINIVAENRDYSPFAKERIRQLETLEKLDIKLLFENDYYLYEPGSINVSSTDKAYMKFTPFYNKVKKIAYDKPLSTYKIKFGTKKISTNYSLKEAANKLIKINDNLLVCGGRINGKNILKKINSFKNYDSTRNELSTKTTQLSAYIKYGCISIRETALAMSKNDSLFRQLIWREFYAQILNDYEYVLYGPLKKKYSSIKWSKSKNNLEDWKNALTGFPIVDAAMTQMNTTGYMHNRGRLIVASFLIKTLLISWREGEKYFAQKLTDYDPASNNGNWQWVASTGADSQPYFRIFNPWSQSDEHDPDCVYIKKWLPQLKDIPNKHIHQWYKYYHEYNTAKHILYPKPIVDYSSQREKALEMYKDVLQ